MTVQDTNENRRWDPQQSSRSSLPQHWGDFVACHAQCVLKLQAGTREEAYNRLQAGVQPFMKVTPPPLPFTPIIKNLLYAEFLADLVSI